MQAMLLVTLSLVSGLSYGQTAKPTASDPIVTYVEGPKTADDQAKFGKFLKAQAEDPSVQKSLAGQFGNLQSDEEKLKFIELVGTHGGLGLVEDVFKAYNENLKGNAKWDFYKFLGKYRSTRMKMKEPAAPVKIGNRPMK